MAKQIFIPKVNDIVRSKELKGIFKVTGVQIPPEKCFIGEFNVSKQVLIGDSPFLVSSDTLVLFSEDANQAAARIVREATER